MTRQVVHCLPQGLWEWLLAEPTRHSSLQFYVTVVYSSLDVLPVRHVDGPFKSIACSYFSVTDPLEASSRPTQTVSWTRTIEEIRVHAAPSCTWHGDERRTVNNGDGPWKHLCSDMRPALNDDQSISQSINTPLIPLWQSHVVTISLETQAQKMQ